jgi:predicted transcriptional regulator
MATPRRQTLRAHPPAEDWTRELVRELAKYRADQGLSQAEVARRMGTSQPYVARLEGAEIDPRISTVLRYAAVIAGGLVLARLVKDILGGPAPPIR